MTTEQTRNNRRVLRGLAAVLVIGTPGYVTVIQVEDLLAQLEPRPSADAVHFLAVLTSGGNLPADLGVPVGPAQEIERGLAPAWLATYLVTAAARLQEAEAITPGDIADAEAKEASYFVKHLAAEERRMRSAAMQDMAAKLLDDRVPDDLAGLLGWHSTIDNRTTPECRWANGRNYRADSMPEIGWPGAVHIHCRCLAGPPTPGAPLIPSV